LDAAEIVPETVGLRWAKYLGKMSDFTIITSDNPRDEEPLAIIADIETGMKKTDGRKIRHFP